MPEPFTVLFVCVGNICRSPLAARLLRARLDEQLGDLAPAVVVESAGVRAVVGHSMDEMAAAQLSRFGLTNDGFTARQLTESIAREADLVLTATKDVRSRVLEEAPAALRRTFTITELAALVTGERADSARTLVADAAQRRPSAQVQNYDVPDPIGKDADVHREAADLIDAAVTPIAEALASAVRTAADVRPS